MFEKPIIGDPKDVQQTKEYQVHFLQTSSTLGSILEEMKVSEKTDVSFLEKDRNLENILQDVCERYAVKVSNFQDTCTFRLRILEVSKNSFVVFSPLNITE